MKVVCKQAPGEDGENIRQAKRAGKRENEEFGGLSDRGGSLCSGSPEACSQARVKVVFASHL